MSNELNINLLEWQVKVLLKALQTHKEKLKELNLSSDEDVAADAGNDLVELNMTKKHLEGCALAVFGEEVLNLSDEPL